VYKRVNKIKERLPFNFITGIVVGVINLVLSIIWQDKNLVRFLTTAHSCSNKDVNEVNWRRPRAYNSFLKKLVANVWGDNPVKKLTLPRVSIDYNNWIGGVNIYNQLRSYYTTQITTIRT
jgi:hypothetical protein